MKKVIRKRIRYEKDGVHVNGDVQATIAANVGRKGSRTSVKSTQRIVQRSTSRHAGGKEGRPKD
jgi:hypothetical protein